MSSKERYHFDFEENKFFDGFKSKKKDEDFLNFLKEDLGISKSFNKNKTFPSIPEIGSIPNSVDVEKLKAQASYLESQLSTSQAKLDIANGQILRLTRQHELSEEIISYQAQNIKNLQAELTKTQQTQTDKLDPKGYCKALGDNPEILRSLNDEEAEKYLKSLRNAQAFAAHTDRPGTAQDVEAMKAVNSAYEFLKNPSNRRWYGR